VIPLRIRGSVSRSIAFERALDGGWRSAEHATPMFRTGMAIPGDGELAYLAKRPAGYDSEGHELTETGVIGHGRNGGELAAHAAEEIRTWDRNFRHRSVRFEIHTDRIDDSDPTCGRFFLDRPHHPITVIWQ
jgi:protein-L-isoaspartate(D-aspartate) O-methyltransferase